MANKLAILVGSVSLIIIVVLAFHSQSLKRQNRELKEEIGNADCIYIVLKALLIFGSLTKLTRSFVSKRKLVKVQIKKPNSKSLRYLN